MTENAANITDEISQPIPQAAGPIPDAGCCKSKINNSFNEVERQGQTAQAPEPAQIAEHPLLNFLDLAVDQSAQFCKSQDLPEPKTALYTHFSRPLMNRALWAYVPESATPESPAVCLFLGTAGIAIMYAPAFMEYQKREKEKAREERKEKRENLKTGLSFEDLRPGQEPGNQERPGNLEADNQEVKQQDPGNKKINVEIGALEEIPEEFQSLNNNYEPMPGL